MEEGCSVDVCRFVRLDCIEDVPEYLGDFICEYKFIEEAIKEAKQGEQEKGIPIGCVLVKDWKIIGWGHNRRVQKNKSAMHGEIDCIQNAIKRLKRLGDINYMNRIKGSILYTTHMPCYMCAGYAIKLGVSKVVAGESSTFPHAKEYLEKNGIEVVDLNMAYLKRLLREFIRRNPHRWEKTSEKNTPFMLKNITNNQINSTDEAGM